MELDTAAENSVKIVNDASSREETGTIGGNSDFGVFQSASTSGLAGVKQDAADTTNPPASFASVASGRPVEENERGIRNTFVEIDTSTYNSCYEVRNLNSARIVHAIRTTFGEDDSRKIIAPRRGDTTWKVETSNIEQYKEVTVLTHENKNLASVTVRTEHLVVNQDTGRIVRQREPTNRQRTSRHNEGELLITLQGADSFPFRNVTDEEITTKIIEMGVGNIKRNVQKQPRLESPDEFTGNKYFILQNLSPGDVQRLPNSFDFYDNEMGTLRRMWLSWKGKPRRCRFCGKFHGEVCELEEQVRKMERERDAAKDKDGHLPLKTYADSTFRHARQDALLSDVDAMSGACTGNILNAIEIDPGVEGVKNMVIIAGQNELAKSLSPKEFLWTLKKKSERLTVLAEQKKIALLEPPRSNQYITSAEEKAKQVYLIENLAELSEGKENITVWQNPCAEYLADFGNHPTEDQTLEIIDFLHDKTTEFFGSGYKLPSSTPEVTTCATKYAKINGLYKYGCAGCNRKERNKWYHLCNACKEELESDEWLAGKLEEFEEMVDFINQVEYPMMQPDSDGDAPPTCETCDAVLGSGAEIREHYKQNHPEMMEASQTGVDIRDKFKSRKSNDVSASKKGRRSKSLPEKGL